MGQELTVNDFYREAKEGKILGLKCDLGHITIPPRYSCRVCQSPKLEIVRLSGKGKIINYTEVYAKSRDFPLDAPYTLALVRLAEGGNLFGTVLDEDSAKISFGTNVDVTFKEVESVASNSIRQISSEKGRPRIFFKISV